MLAFMLAGGRVRDVDQMTCVRSGGAGLEESSQFRISLQSLERDIIYKDLYVAR